MASELFLVNPRGKRRSRRARRNPAGSLLVLNPRRRRTRRSSSSKAARALRLAKRLRKHGATAKQALKRAWAKILHTRKRTTRVKRTRTSYRPRRKHRRRKSATSRRLHMARRKRRVRRSHKRHVRRITRRAKANPVRHRRHRSHRTARRHSRRGGRRGGMLGFLKNPMSLGSFFVLPSVKTALWVGGGALATWYVSNRFVSPLVGRFLPAQIAPIVGNLATAGVLAGVAGMVAGREAAVNVAIGGVTYAVLEVAVPMLTGLLAPRQVAAPAAAGGTGYYMGDVNPETAAAMDYYMGG